MSTTDYAAAAARRALLDAAEHAGRAEAADTAYRAALTERDRAEVAALRAAGHADDVDAERARVAATGRAASARLLAACDRAEEEHRRARGALLAARDAAEAARRAGWRACTEAARRAGLAAGAYADAARRAELAGLEVAADAAATEAAALAELWTARAAVLAADV